MATLRHPVPLAWTPPGVRAELEAPARRADDGRLVVVRARGGGVRARRAWLVADGDGADPYPALLGAHAGWILKSAARRWPSIAKRLDEPVVEAERLARLGVIEIDCRLTPSLGLEGFVGWQLTGWAREEHQRRQAAGSALRTDLELELREPHLIAWLRAGHIPQGMSWADCVRVLRGASEWLDMAAHGGGPPQERELAVHASGDSKWEWTEPRRALLAQLVGRPVGELFAHKLRVVRAQGNVDGLRTNLFDVEVEDAPLRLTGPVRAILCIENLQSFNALYPLADEGWWVLQIPGYAPPAERRALARVHALIPDAPVFAAFDADPDGIHIAVLLQRDTGVALRSELMAPDILDLLVGRALTPTDRDLLRRLCSHAGAFEPLRAALEARQIKGGEQEGLNHWLLRRARELVDDRA